MILSTPNYLLELYLGSSVASELRYAVSWVDHNNGTTLSSVGGQSNGINPVTVVPAPNEGTKRQIQELTIYNPNTSAVTVTVQVKNNSASITSIKKKQTLQAKETLQYTENIGWKITDIELNFAILDARYVNASGNDTMTGSLSLPSLSATTVRGINYSGIYLNSTVEDVSIDFDLLASGQFLEYNGTSWQNTWITTDQIYPPGQTPNFTGDSPGTPFVPVTAFTQLNDTFSTYSGVSGFAVVVNSSGTALTAVPTSSIGVNSFSQLTDAFFIDDSTAGKLVYVREDGTGLSPLASSLFQPAGDYAYLSGASFSGNVTVFAHLAAVTKSFLIKHPFFPLKKLLRYACLEGPENGVYVRGRLINSDIIELPDYWRKLVDPDSITVQITPIGSNQKLFIKKVENNKVYLDYESFTDYIKIDCYYLVQAERCDVPKLIVEL